MASRIDLFDSTYSNFSEQVLRAIREETFDRARSRQRFRRTRLLPRLQSQQSRHRH